MAKKWSNPSKEEKDSRPSFVPPHATTAEQMLLGILMAEARSWDDLNIRLTAQDFYDPRHKSIFAAIHSLIEQNKPVDAITVIESLNLEKQLDKAGGKDYIAELAQNADMSGSSYAYSDLIQDRSLRRQLMAAGQSILREVNEGGATEVHQLIDRAEGHIFTLSDDEGNKQDIQSTKSLIPRTLKDIDLRFKNQGKLLGVGSGFRDLDNMTAGLQKADFIVIAGRPSMGKTSFALNLAVHAAVEEKCPTVIFSMEMDSTKILARLIATLGNVHLGRMRDGYLTTGDWMSIRQAADILTNSPIYLDDSSSLNPMEVRSRLRRVKRMLPKDKNIGLVIIDYIQLMNAVKESDNRVAEMTEISRSMKTIAKEFNVPLVGLSQLNRALESRQDKRPVMADLRESGAIEQDADVIMMIYRPEFYEKDDPSKKGKAQIRIEKQRNGPTGVINLSFKENFSTFRTIERTDYTDVNISHVS